VEGDRWGGIREEEEEEWQKDLGLGKWGALTRGLPVTGNEYFPGGKLGFKGDERTKEGCRRRGQISRSSTP